MGPEGWLDDGHSADRSRQPSGESGSGCLAVVTSSGDETRRLGAMLGRLLRPTDLILLQGPLGAGKTTFTQGIARGYGFSGRVTSPSFTLANVYEPTATGYPLYHLDLWRIKSPAEALGLGLEEYLSGRGPVVIEWPEVAESVLPFEYLQVKISPENSRRRFEFCAVGDRPRELLEEFRRAISAAQPGEGAAHAARD